MQETSKAQEESRSILAETRGVVNSLSVPAVVIDRNGVIQAFNAMAETLLGYSMVDVVGEKVQMIMNEQDAARHDSYLKAYISTGVAKVIGKTREVLAKTVDGRLVPVVLSLSKTVDPNNADDFLFTGILLPTNPMSGKEDSSQESSSLEQSGRNHKQMNSVGDNSVITCAAVRDFGTAEDANVQHRSAMEDAWVMVDDFMATPGDAFFAIYDGHNGIEAAEFCMGKLHHFLRRAVQVSFFDCVHAASHACAHTLAPSFSARSRPRLLCSLSAPT